MSVKEVSACFTGHREIRKKDARMLPETLYVILGGLDSSWVYPLSHWWSQRF